MSDNEKTKFSDPSWVVAEFERHVLAMEPCSEIPEQHSFALDRNSYKLPLLKDLAMQLSVGKKAYVVIDHGNVLEVARLKDGADPKLLYKHFKTAPNEPEPKTGDLMQDAEKLVIEHLNAYKDLQSDTLATYDKNLTAEMKHENIISHTFLHKRISNLALFKKSKVGGTALLKQVLENLNDSGLLTKIPDNVAKNTYETNGVLYQINEVIEDEE